MINTTLCYIEKDGKYLMLLRNKKENDLNEGKWVGVGGKFEKGETAEECLVREVYEETGLTLKKWHYYGVVNFVSDKWEDEAMYLYLGTGFEGEMNVDCAEGELRWVDKEDVLGLPMWEGDPYFLKRMLSGDEHISMTLKYKGDTLIEVLG